MVSSSTLSPGTRIAGTYEVEGLLGRGGVGVVYRAMHVGTGRRVAVKVLHDVLLDRDEMRRRFELEARAASVIKHPGIVDVFDLGETDEGDPFIVLEYLEGASLRTLSRQAEGLSPGQVVGALLPVLDALAAAHAAGVVHRDVKPANVFVASRPRGVKLLDFGVAHFGGSGVTHAGDTVGTPRYMAPEQVLGLPDIGPEADLYSVGAVLFMLLAGRPPHQGVSDGEALARVVNEAAPPLASVTQGLPAGLCAVVDELLVKEPSRRPKDAAAVRARLAEMPLDLDLTSLFARAARHARETAPTPPGARSQKTRSVDGTNPHE
jgi:serine/threonine-protein kinase